ncbi:MAG: hypothetical protein ACD_71C00135G0001, partial [uncultured bacterium (gcode 4)]
MPHLYELDGSPFLHLHSRVFREDDLRKPELHRLIHAFLEAENILHD